jgi:hypothetical protein
MLRKKMLEIGALTVLVLLTVVSPVAAAAAPKAGASSAPLADEAIVRAPDCANAKHPPPALSPMTPIRSGSTPSLAACSLSHFRAV